MVTRQSAPLGAPTWIDLSTSDPERAQQFYGTVFGWRFENSGPEYGGYVTASVDGRVVAGLMRNDPQWNAPDAWTTYLHTADADATVAAATAAGASNCVGVMDIPAKGRMAMLTDITNGFFGIWQPGGHDGFAVFNEAGAPTYHQLTTTDYARSLDFYRTVFSWNTETVSDTEEFRYSTANFDGEALVGVMDGSAFLPAGAPSVWSTFFGSDDVDKSIELIVANGGSVLRAAEDTPYGRLAAVADPTGAEFNLSSLPG
ncbi:VOC family protein [Mycobacterium sp. TNTM28]|uniref:VOC family protein n=1 Tax=[Mycobacterium] fortunisiensis TaxID=2600579 RepID=A0ABS6KIQ8_9MYCO|nr:VOC family protein [[Mycobacterium] fortunisiensis]MBU9763399.1 VOC family protein [[Mycobacterium] fortunisiensis]